MNNSNKILEINNLQTIFDTENGIVKAVDGISFSLNKGETLGIVGESGSGKSVTALSIMHLIKEPPGKIENGEIYFHKETGKVDLLKLPKKEMPKYRGKEIAMIFQEPMTSLNPVFKCGDQIVEAIILHQKISKKDAENQTLQLFEKVLLPDPERIFQAYPHELSGGQKQRVMIAMAISCQPKILIADEPTTALDVTVQKTILDLLNQLKSELGAGIIFITHDLGVIAEIADNVAVMYQGKIVETGTVENIFKNPRHPYTKSLLACRPPMDFKLKRLPVADDFLEVIENEDGQKELIEKPINIEGLYTELKISNANIEKSLKKITQNEPLVSVKNLSTYFPSKRNFFGKTIDYLKAVDDVSFDIYEGEILGLVGESGCGKTTLGRTILRLQNANKGEVFYNNQNLLSLSDSEMRKLRKEIQIIFQDPYSSLNPRMSVGQAILEPMLLHGLVKNKKEGETKVMELLETVQLKKEHFHRFPNEFSGGQRQRICIARALAVEPKFLICDECVSALDVSVQANILNLLLDLRERFNLSYLFISHDLSVVQFVSDRIMVMNRGKIEEIGSATQVYHQPKKEYTKQLIAAIPRGR